MGACKVDPIFFITKIVEMGVCGQKSGNHWGILIGFTEPWVANLKVDRPAPGMKKGEILDVSGNFNFCFNFCLNLFKLV